ncbi:hypothetical protein [Spiroplasma endosymbiont of Crioceris asparagi]|uniref:hypothetical protein n=1 Tax=Spiroplasma endosymbiont of Crioceris asparagi TaxID=3066286 RepID=UPI0030CEBC9A
MEKIKCVLCYTEILNEKELIVAKKPSAGIFNRAKVKMHQQCYQFFKKMDSMIWWIIGVTGVLSLVVSIALLFTTGMDEDQNVQLTDFVILIPLIIWLVIWIMSFIVYFVKLHKFKKGVQNGKEIL